MRLCEKSTNSHISAPLNDKWRIFKRQTKRSRSLSGLLTQSAIKI